MLAHLVGLIGLAWLLLLGGPDRASAEQTPPADYESLKSMMDQLEKDSQTAVDKWKQSGANQIPLLKSPLVPSDALAANVPPECLSHLQDEKAKFEQGDFSKEAWLHHIFACEQCCAPLLADVMDIHVEHVIDNRHLVVLFRFDSFAIEERYQQRLDTLLKQFDPLHDELLLIGRASRIGRRSYNLILSGKRAGEIKDYAMDKFAIGDEKIHYLFFGFDPPQLTPALATRYGVSDDEIASIDPGISASVADKINQSVVVIINKNSHDAASPQDISQEVTAQKAPQPLNQPPILTAATPPLPSNRSTPAESKLAIQGTAQTQPSPTKPTLDLAVTPSESPSPGTTKAANLPKPESLKESQANTPAQSTALTVVTGPSVSPSGTLGQDVASFARQAGFKVTIAEAADSLNTVRQMLASETPTMGMIPSNIISSLTHIPELDIKRAGALRLLFPMYNQEIHLLALKTFQQAKDLNGKRVIIGLKGSTTWMTARHVLNLLEVQPAEMIDHLSPADAIATVLAGKADAAFYITEKPAAMFSRINDFRNYPHLAPLVQGVGFIPLNLTNTEQHGYLASTIGPTDYAWVEQKVPTLAVKVVLAIAQFEGEHIPAHCRHLTTFGQVIRTHISELRKTGHAKWQDVDLQLSLPAWKHATCLQLTQTDSVPRDSSNSKFQ